MTRMASDTSNSMRLRLRLDWPLFGPAAFAGAGSLLSLFTLLSKPSARLWHEATAQGLHQIDREIERAGLQLRLEAALHEQLRFGAQDLQIISQALAIPQHRQIVGLLGAGEGVALLGTLAAEAVHGRQSIDDFTQRVGHDLVVLFDRRIVLRILRGELRAALAGVEQRQGE